MVWKWFLRILDPGPCVWRAWPLKKEVAYLLPIVLVGFFLRASLVDRASVGVDAYLLEHAADMEENGPLLVGPAMSGILFEYSSDVDVAGRTPGPILYWLYYVFLKGWPSEYGVFWFSVFAGTAAIVASHLLIRELFGSGVALAGSLVMATASFHIYMSLRNVGYNVVGLLFMLLSLFLLSRALLRQQPRCLIVGIVLGLLGLQVHISYSLPFVIALGMVVCFGIQLKKQHLAGVVICSALVFFPFIIHEVTHDFENTRSYMAFLDHLTANPDEPSENSVSQGHNKSPPWSAIRASLVPILYMGQSEEQGRLENEKHRYELNSTAISIQRLAIWGKKLHLLAFISGLGIAILRAFIGFTRKPQISGCRDARFTFGLMLLLYFSVALCLQLFMSVIQPTLTSPPKFYWLASFPSHLAFIGLFVALFRLRWLKQLIVILLIVVSVFDVLSHFAIVRSIITQTGLFMHSISSCEAERAAPILRGKWNLSKKDFRTAFREEGYRIASEQEPFIGIIGLRLFYDRLGISREGLDDLPVRPPNHFFMLSPVYVQREIPYGDILHRYPLGALELIEYESDAELTVQQSKQVSFIADSREHLRPGLVAGCPMYVVVKLIEGVNRSFIVAEISWHPDERAGILIHSPFVKLSDDDGDHIGEYIITESLGSGGKGGAPCRNIFEVGALPERPQLTVGYRSALIEGSGEQGRKEWDLHVRRGHDD